MTQARSASRVHSLAILEPALYSVPSAQTSRAFVGTAVQLYRAGDHAGAVDTFLRGVCGPGYRAVLDQDRTCSSPGCPTSSPSSRRPRRTCCRCRIRAAWPLNP